MLPRPETALDAKRDAAKGFMYQANRAFQDGVWQTDGSRHTIGMSIDKDELGKGTMIVTAKPGKPTLRVAYFFSGVTRKASIADELRKLCERDGFGLQVFEIDCSSGALSTICSIKSPSRTGSRGSKLGSLTL